MDRAFVRFFPFALIISSRMYAFLTLSWYLALLKVTKAWIVDMAEKSTSCAYNFHVKRLHGSCLVGFSNKLKFRLWPEDERNQPSVRGNTRTSSVYSRRSRSADVLSRKQAFNRLRVERCWLPCTYLICMLNAT